MGPGVEIGPIRADRWMSDAACAKIGYNDAFWFPDHGTDGDAAASQRICGGCPVYAECLAYAVARPGLVGIWAGTGQNERKSIRNEASGKARARPRPGPHYVVRSHQPHMATAFEAVTALLERLYQGPWTPRLTLPEMAAETGCSQTAVKDAMTRMRSAGSLITRREGRGGRGHLTLVLYTLVRDA
jgi:hypothetical protein